MAHLRHSILISPFFPNLKLSASVELGRNDPLHHHPLHQKQLAKIKQNHAKFNMNLQLINETTLSILCDIFAINLNDL